MSNFVRVDTLTHDIADINDSNGSSSDAHENIDEYMKMFQGNFMYKLENQAHHKERVERQPTRRPDPNVYNRNALMARENRRKKKEYLETVEKELEGTRIVNQLLLKRLKKQQKMLCQLQREKQFFKNILANHTEIVKVMTALNANFSIKNRDNTSLSSNSTIDSEGRASNTTPTTIFTNINEGTQERHPGDFITFEGMYNDHELTSSFNDNWDKVFMAEIEKSNTAKLTSLDTLGVQNDHRYISAKSLNFKQDSSGVCLHIAQGKVSLEFCPDCHWNATSNVLPTQLLQDA